MDQENNEENVGIKGVIGHLQLILDQEDETSLLNF
jgi:hypothetical protein